jgi:antitoxin HicB
MKPIIESLVHYPMEISAITADGNGGYSACVPSLGRLTFEATGRTIDEAISNLRKVSEILLGEFRERGVDLPDPPPNPDEYSGRLLLRIPKHIHRRLDREARENGVSLNTYLISILSNASQAPQIEKLLKEISSHISPPIRSKSILASEYKTDWNVIYGKKVVGL